ncbi:TetR/AcrR family transcriptional regulator [Agromyces sp. H66]|uniref:TetR/AcrR family transcriptional regulator n=1 Tax=Agromyces sp. H66 TaxID=2529859 RepID=UPI0010AA036D|nr:TetR/AcrR family transcriptional regulator [Agromyces sp. H66]
MSNNVAHDRVDLRSRRTEQHLRDALVALMAQRGYDSITVVDICDRAMVHRTTFYKHYEDKFDLLDDVLDTRLLELLGPDVLAGDPARPGPDEVAHLLLRMAGRIQADRDFFGLLASPDATSLVPRLTEALRRRLLETPRGARASAHDRERAELQAHLHAALIVNAITWWMARPDRLTPAEVAEVLTGELTR